LLEDQAKQSILPFKPKEEAKKSGVTDKLIERNLLLGLSKPAISNSKVAVSSLVHGCYLPTQNQGYISQQKQQKTKRIQSSRQTKRQPKGDLFENSRLPPKPDRPLN